MEKEMVYGGMVEGHEKEIVRGCIKFERVSDESGGTGEARGLAH